MQLATASGNVSGQYTDGNPVSGTPATVIDANWLNAVQNEIISVLTQAGISCNSAVNNQLLTSIQQLINSGANPAAAAIAILNNQASAVNLTGMLFSGTNFRAVRIPMSIYILTDSSVELNEVGVLTCVYKPSAGIWACEWEGNNADDAGIVFSINSSGQVQYTSTNQAFVTSYVGQIRVAGVTTFGT
jgi:hypothetical protein